MKCLICGAEMELTGKHFDKYSFNSYYALRWQHIDRDTTCPVDTIEQKVSIDNKKAIRNGYHIPDSL